MGKITIVKALQNLGILTNVRKEVRKNVRYAVGNICRYSSGAYDNCCFHKQLQRIEV